MFEIPVAEENVNPRANCRTFWEIKLLIRNHSNIARPSYDQVNKDILWQNDRGLTITLVFTKRKGKKPCHLYNSLNKNKAEVKDM